MASIASTRGHPGGKLLDTPLRARRFGEAERTSTSWPRGCPRVEAMLAIALLNSHQKQKKGNRYVADRY
jgi:hypothetical protein